MPRRKGAPRKTAGEPGAEPRKGSAGGAYWVFGQHAVRAVLGNAERRIRRLVATSEAAQHLAEMASARVPVEAVERRAIESHLPSGAVHQGMAALVEPMPECTIDQIGARPGPKIVVVLDRVTDPHNVGAILRSSAAFGAAAVVVTERHAAPATGTLAKAASGALELVPLVRVVNLAQALLDLKDHGFWCIGLDAAAPEALSPAGLGENVALVLGAEGEGLRRLTRERCDSLARLTLAPGASGFSSLNVSNAAAIALHIAAQRPAAKG